MPIILQRSFKRFKEARNYAVIPLLLVLIASGVATSALADSEVNTGYAGWNYTFGNSIQIGDKLGLQIDEPKYENGWLVIESTYARSSCCYASFPPSINIEKATSSFSVNYIRTQYDLFNSGLETAVYKTRTVFSESGITEQTAKVGFNYGSPVVVSTVPLTQQDKVKITSGSPYYAYGATTTVEYINTIQVPVYNSSTAQPIFNVGNNSGNQNTRFISAVITGTTTNPKNVFVTVTYYLDPSEINRSISSKNPSQIALSVAQRPGTAFTKYGFEIPTTLGTSTQTFTLLDSDLNDNATFDLLIQFSNAGVPFGSDIPFEDSYIYTSFTLTSKLVTGTSTIENYNSQTVAGTTLTSQPCGVTALSGCINNAFTYLFVPSASTIDSFKNLQSTLATKFPFAYIYDFQSSITSLYNENNTQASSIVVPFGTYGTISLISKTQLQNVPFSSWIKTTLGYLLWIMFGLQMYRRSLRIFNPQTT